MGSSLFFFSCLLAMALLSLSNPAIAQNGPSIHVNLMERDALLALISEFNNSFLHDNWTKTMCYLYNPSDWYGIECSNGRVSGIVLENMGLTGKIKLDALLNLTHLSVLSFKNNSISGKLMNFSSNHKLTQIDLSWNMFDGPISDSLTTLDFLESLQLQGNELNGSVPAFNRSSLREFNISNNRLSGPLPNTPVLQSFGSSSFSGNPELCGPPSPSSSSSSSSTAACNVSTNDTSGPSDSNSENTKNDGHSTESHSFLSIFLVVNVVGLLIIVFLFIIYLKKSRKIMMKRSLVERQEEKAEKIQMIDVSLVAATEGESGKLTFMDDEVGGFELDDLLRASAEGLGKGNVGNCYKAMIDGGPAVVVKRLRDLKPLSHVEFTRQLQAIADQKHPNLLPILAYYYSNEEKLLVTRFVSNGNIYNRIHGGRGTQDRIPFRWSARLSVARGVARALEYLHLNPKSQQSIVPHGNLKSSNVLLDENDIVLVSDYGLSSLIAPPIAAQRMVSHRSPEYQSYKKLSKMSDVWSYGCLLLELLTGRVSVHAAPPGAAGIDLGSWVHRAVREEWTAEILDVEISAQRSANHAMLRLLEIAIRCCDKSPEKRPEMTAVVREVENIKVVVDLEDEEDLSSLDQSLTDDSMSATPSR